MTHLEVLAIIPARGGSRGIPRKNLRTVSGRPLVVSAIEAALEAETVSRVVVSTDDDEIAGVAIAAGAEVPWRRPAELASDDARDVGVMTHALDALAVDGYRPDILVNVRPTAPLRTAADIDGAVRALVDTPGARSVKAVSAVLDHPYKMWTLADGVLVPIRTDWHDERGGDPDAPRQSLPHVYRSSAAVDAVWVKALLETGRIHPGPIAAYVIDYSTDVDVDTEADLDRVQFIAERRSATVVTTEGIEEPDG